MIDMWIRPLLSFRVIVLTLHHCLGVDWKGSCNTQHRDKRSTVKMGRALKQNWFGRGWRLQAAVMISCQMAFSKNSLHLSARTPAESGY